MLNLLGVSIHNPPLSRWGPLHGPPCDVCGAGPGTTNHTSLSTREDGLIQLIPLLIMGSLLTNTMYKRMTFFNMGIDCRILNSYTDTDRDTISLIYSRMMTVANGSQNVVNFCRVGLGRFRHLVW